jgi:hypothetical protein
MGGDSVDAGIFDFVCRGRWCIIEAVGAAGTELNPRRLKGKRMSEIVLHDDQAKAFAAARDTVRLLDRKGQVLGYVSRDFSPADVAEAQRRRAKGGPGYTTQQVLDHLRSLESR